RNNLEMLCVTLRSSSVYTTMSNYGVNQRWNKAFDTAPACPNPN
ncbi:MAG: hypothetical protein ACI80M_001098, partial [Gammaproteobacteria bacterium]